MTVGLDDADSKAVLETLHSLSRGADLDDAGAQVLTDYPHPDIATGERLQLALLERLMSEGDELGGWKIGWTSRGARTGAGADGDRPFGFVQSDHIVPSGTALDLSMIPKCKLEPEIALILGETLSGQDVTPEQAKAAVSAVAPAFEVCSSRLRPGMSIAVRVGNALNNWGIVMGEKSPPDIALDSITVEFYADGALVDTGSSGPDILDDPFLSLSRVANLLGSHGLDLLPGQVFITGSLMAPAVVEAGRHYEARFADFGTVAVQF